MKGPCVSYTPVRALSASETWRLVIFTFSLYLEIMKRFLNIIVSPTWIIYFPLHLEIIKRFLNIGEGTEVSPPHNLSQVYEHCMMQVKPTSKVRKRVVSIPWCKLTLLLKCGRWWHGEHSVMEVNSTSKVRKGGEYKHGCFPRLSAEGVPRPLF